MMKWTLLVTLLLSFTGPAMATTIKGTVTVDKKIAKKMPAKGALFIFARSAANGGKGFPLAVKKVDSPKFPVSFSLSQDNSMVKGTVFEGPIKVIARFSPSGDVMAKKGSFEGEVGSDGKVKVGQKAEVSITINKEL